MPPEPAVVQAPPGLPIYSIREDLRKLVMEQRVVILVGGTGCGKSTQVPQFILDEAKRVSEARQEDIKANVLVTQPRRLAAESLARRVAQERGEALGDQVGYRISGDVRPGEQLSYVTAGYLLSWFTVDPLQFEAVTHIILDEAHERSADMELLLLLVRLLMQVHRGPRLILMSATIDASFFADYYKAFRGKSELKPLVLPDRLHPVEEVYIDDIARGIGPSGIDVSGPPQVAAKHAVTTIFEKQLQAVLDRPRQKREAEQVLTKLLPRVAEAGTTLLVFVPGYSDLCRLHSRLYWGIRDDDPRGDLAGAPPRLVDIEGTSEEADLVDEETADGPHQLPPEIIIEDGSWGAVRSVRLFALHSQVPAGEQDLVFTKPGSDCCHIVLATTIAESSLTLPEVCGVIDFCVHRTAWHDPQQPGLLQLTTRWCSQASASQRAGRAGRTRPGWCVRLVPRQFFQERMPDQEEPEIRRTPLVTLFLRAQGICQGLGQIAKSGTTKITESLQRQVREPTLVLETLPCAPSKMAVRAAIKELAQLGALTQDSAESEATSLGELALQLPVDVRLCRIIWLGALWGCLPEAIIIAASCSSPDPFDSPSRLAYGDPAEFLKDLVRAFDSKAKFDGGYFSEHIMRLRLFCNWARRLARVSPKLEAARAWMEACTSLAEDEAISTGRMYRFLSIVSDLAVKALSLCSVARDDPVRNDCMLLLRLLRRPDLSYKEQKALTREEDPEPPPRVGEVFRASSRMLFALLGASLSDQLLTGSHVKGKRYKAQMETLQSLEKGGEGSTSSILFYRGFDMDLLENKRRIKRMVEGLCGKTPEEVVKAEQGGSYAVVRFKRRVSAKQRRIQAEMARANPVFFGLPPAEVPRLNSLDTAARLCFMASGGFRTFTTSDGHVLNRPESPYELKFNLAHASVTNRKIMPGIFSDLGPLGSPVHVLPKDAPVGDTHFAAVGAALSIGEGGSFVRALDVTLLTAEQILYVLTTLCPKQLSLSFGLVRGPGGSADRTHASLKYIRFKRFGRPMMLQRNLPANVAIDKLNAVRTGLMSSLIEGRTKMNSDGSKILLWEDQEMKDKIHDLIDFVDPEEGADDDLDEAMFEEFPMPEDVEAAYIPVSSSGRKRTVRHTMQRPDASDVEGERQDEEGGDEQGSDEDEADDDDDEAVAEVETEEEVEWNIQALHPLALEPSYEQQVARRVRAASGKITHKFECPDCNEHFDSWEEALEHYQDTGHLDVSTEMAVLRAKAWSQPQQFFCLECGMRFPDKSTFKAHRKETGHMKWAKLAIAYQLCSVPGPEEAGTTEAEKRRLVAAVKRLQSGSRQKEQAWEEFIREKKRGRNLDPASYDVEVLREWLLEECGPAAS